jgi:hypothetical protein
MQGGARAKGCTCTFLNFYIKFFKNYNAAFLAYVSCQAGVCKFLVPSGLGIAIPGSRIPGSRTFSQSRNPGIGWLQSRDFGIDNLVHFYVMITVF